MSLPKNIFIYVVIMLNTSLCYLVHGKTNTISLYHVGDHTTMIPEVLGYTLHKSGGSKRICSHIFQISSGS